MKTATEYLANNTIGALFFLVIIMMVVGFLIGKLLNKM